MKGKILSATETFLSFRITCSSDGVVVCDDIGANAMPGAMNFGEYWTKAAVDSAKKAAFTLFLIKYAKDFNAALFYRVNTKGGAVCEWYTFEDVCKREGIAIPPELSTPYGGNAVIRFNVQPTKPNWYEREP